MQRLQSAVTEQRRIWENITLVVVLDSLHDNFEMTTALLFHSGDKNLEEIQQIVTSTETANLAKRAVGTTTDLAMMVKKKHSDKQHATKSKANEEYFNCGKKGHYAKDCHPSNKKKPKESAEEAKRTW